MFCNNFIEDIPQDDDTDIVDNDTDDDDTVDNASDDDDIMENGTDDKEKSGSEGIILLIASIIVIAILFIVIFHLPLTQ